jgi:hypothetical protein
LKVEFGNCYPRVALTRCSGVPSVTVPGSDDCGQSLAPTYKETLDGDER